jgi:general secretion pathway protein A
VVDEAHHLSAEILEEIRLLTNLETAQEKLLQILLVGQPELDEKLDSVGLRQLKQRIAARAHLTALDPAETRGYIANRLRLAGGEMQLDALFPEATVDAIYRHSRGFPRLINTICENTLIASYARQARIVTPEMVEEIAREFRLNVVYTPTAERTGQLSEPEVKRAAKALLDLYANLQKPDASESERRTPVSFRTGKNEPYI